MKERIRWIDIAKFFGIFAIYLGHFGGLVGKSYYFVFSHHVPLFFFISGCMEIYNREDNLVKYVIKKIKTIMIPFWVFAALSAIVATIYGEYHWGTVKALIVEVARGVIRNTYVAASLWFLTCLFVMQLMFFIIKKVKYKVLIFAIVLGTYIIANYVLNPHPLGVPSMYYNVDSALYYLIYYTIGYLAFPYILKLFELDTKKKKVLFGTTAILSLGYTMGMFFGVDVLSYLNFPQWSGIYTAVFATCIMIYAYLVVAKIVEDVEVLADIGKNTLYLCGSEYIIKLIVSSFAGIFGLSICVPTPLAGYIYTGVLLFVANKYLVPIEKYIINKIVR